MSTEQEQVNRSAEETNEQAQEAQTKEAQETKTEQTDSTEKQEEQAPQDDPQAKLDEMKDKYLRLYADFDNYKKRMAKERLELMKDAGKDIILNLLPVMDDFTRAVKAAENAADATSVKEGMELIHGKLLKNLEQKGLKKMEAQGEAFNADLHEAITEIPAPSEELKGKVVDVVEDGYYLNDKIIRYAKVVVGK